jgi:rare lipoprotein A
VLSVLAMLMVVTACTVRWEKPQPTVDGQQRSSQGNPPFYEVHGIRYKVMDSSAGYHERGVASWYGSKFHGNPTSSGETYDMYAMTAAHKNLPLPTMVKVTNLRNGRYVIVRVNDRGPFVYNRIIDMSYAAARELDMIATGTTLVDVAALTTAYRDKPATAAAQAGAPGVRGGASASAAKPATKVVYLQVGAFGEQLNAQLLKSRLNAGGVDNVSIHHELTAEPALYRVRIGPLKDVDEYDKLLDRVESLNVFESHLVVDSRNTTTQALSDGSAIPPGS